MNAAPPMIYDRTVLVEGAHAQAMKGWTLRFEREILSNHSPEQSAAAACPPAFAVRAGSRRLPALRALGGMPFGNLKWREIVGERQPRWGR